jgi:NDP-sugar pyrophosphorylase family protein
MLAVVLAAGLGKRLRPLTDARSKAMLPVAGKPMVERVMERLAAEGVERFIGVARPGDEPLLELLDQPTWRDCIRLTLQEARRGMADAVSCAVPSLREEEVDEFLLASCDNIFPAGHIAALVAYRREHRLDAALTLMQVHPEEIPTLAVVRLENDRVTGIVEKPRPEEAPSDLGSVALYALTPRVLEWVHRVPISPRGEREFPDALRLLIEDGGAVGAVVVASRMTLTSPDHLLALNRRFLRDDPTCAIVEANLPPGVVLAPPVRIEEGVRVGRGCRIGPEVYLEGGCQVGKGSALREAVVLRDAMVPPGSSVRGKVVCASSVL